MTDLFSGVGGCGQDTDENDDTQHDTFVADLLMNETTELINIMKEIRD